MSTLDGITEATKRAHRASWFVYVGEGDARRRIPRQAAMRGLWGYDAVCSCGKFDSRTGGGTKRYVEEKLWEHRWEEQARDDG